MLYFIEDFYHESYANNFTPDSENKHTEFIPNDLVQSSSITFKWLNDNCMKRNTSKNHFLVSSNLRASFKIDNR